MTNHTQTPATGTENATPYPTNDNLTPHLYRTLHLSLEHYSAYVALEGLIEVHGFHEVLDDATLICRFRTDDSTLAISAEVTSKDSFGPRKDTFSWRVLSALADTVSTSVESDDSAEGSHRVRIDLTKGRTGNV